MRSKQGYNFFRIEASILESGKDASNGISGFWDKAIFGRSSSSGPAQEEWYTGCAWAICQPNSVSKLDEVASSKVMSINENFQDASNVVNAVIGRIFAFYISKSDYRTISTSSTARRGPSDSIME
jgi:hypothetical protein